MIACTSRLNRTRREEREKKKSFFFCVCSLLFITKERKNNNNNKHYISGEYLRHSMARKNREEITGIVSCVHLAPLSKKSFASLIFAATYGEPPKLKMEMRLLKGEFTSIGMIENDQAFVSITNTNFISSWTRERKYDQREREEKVGT